MKSRLSWTILVILVAGFGFLSFEISSGNRALEERLNELETGAVVSSSSVARSGRGQRAETVGDLLNRTSVPVDARGILKMIALLQQDLRLVPTYRLGLYLERLSHAELRALRRELRLTPGLEMHREFLENMISVAELRLQPENLGDFFSEVLESERFDKVLQQKLVSWARDDPQAVLEWYRRQVENVGFLNGSLSGGKNHAAVFKSLIKGIAEVDLNLAVETFATARGRKVVSESATEVIAGVMTTAVDSGDESLLRRVLNSPDLPRDFYVRGETGLTEVWLTYTDRTGDVTRSVELLKSLDHDKFFGERMSAIISSQKEMSLEERVAWLKEEIPTESQQLKALEDQYDRSILFDSGPKVDALLEGFEVRESGPERDLELNAFARSLARLSQYDKALEVLEMISDDEYRETVEEALEPFSHDPFGQ